VVLTERDNVVPHGENFELLQRNGGVFRLLTE